MTIFLVFFHNKIIMTTNIIVAFLNNTFILNGQMFSNLNPAL